MCHTNRETLSSCVFYSWNSQFTQNNRINTSQLYLPKYYQSAIVLKYEHVSITIILIELHNEMVIFNLDFCV